MSEKISLDSSDSNSYPPLNISCNQEVITQIR